MALRVTKLNGMGQLKVSHKGSQLGGEKLTVKTAFQAVPQRGLKVSRKPLKGGKMLSPMSQKANGGLYQAVLRIKSK